MQKRKSVVVSEDVLIYLAELYFLLFKDSYFECFENALNYLDEIYDKIFSEIEVVKHIKMPQKLQRFGDYYFVIKANRRTVWHIYFIEKMDTYYITKILNNHLPSEFFLITIKKQGNLLNFREIFVINNPRNY